MPLHLLVKWEVVSPNSRWGQLESISIISSIPLFWFCISNVGGGGGVMFFSHFMLFPTFLEKKSGKKKPIISHLMFFWYAGNIEKCPFTYSYWLNGRWFLQIVDIGHFIMKLEILKVPLHLLVKWGRWFLQIVDIHVGNLNMKLTGKVVSPDSR